MKRGKVWLGAASIVINDNGEWLAVRKAYSGLKGQWSLPAGFVDEGETVDEAAMREVLEETGIVSEICALIGFRTGVIGEEVSDNMAMFVARAKTTTIYRNERELLEVAWLTPEALLQDVTTSNMLITLAKRSGELLQLTYNHEVVPDPIFQYTKYKWFV